LLLCGQVDAIALHFTTSSRSSFSAIASLQKAEIFRQRLFFSRSSAWWSCMALHQKSADELGGNDLGGAGEEGLRECWEGLGGYGSGFKLR